jgi:hypothetical protein
MMQENVWQRTVGSFPKPKKYYLVMCTDLVQPPCRDDPVRGTAAAASSSAK